MALDMKVGLFPSHIVLDWDPAPLPQKGNRAPHPIFGPFLANSRSRSLFAVACRSVVCMSVCRLSSVTFVRRTQAVQTFGNISTALGISAIH